MKKEYQKPEMRAIEIKSEQILLTISDGPGVSATSLEDNTDYQYFD